MTTRRGEPYEAETQTVEDILRPLAEATVWEHKDVKGFHVDQDGTPCPSCERRSIPDPRFEALRQVWKDEHGGIARLHPGFDIDASLGAIVRAAADHGLIWVLFTPGTCLLRGYRTEYPGAGATPEEALARALLAAWRDGKAPSSTEPREH